MKYCVLKEGKVCTNCGECDICDLDPNKICDNCCKCIEGKNKDFGELRLSDFYASMHEKWGGEDEEDIKDDDTCDQQLYPNSDTKLIVRYNKSLRGKRNGQ
jgi:hypothetical protein